MKLETRDFDLGTRNSKAHQVGEHDGGEFAYGNLLTDNNMRDQSGEICEEITGITRVWAVRISA